MDLFAAILFGFAVLHTLGCSWIRGHAQQRPHTSFCAKLLHLLSEVELVFVLWSLLFIAALGMQAGPAAAWHYLAEVNYQEAVFVVCIMTIASTRPVLILAERCIAALARLLPMNETRALYCTSLIAGPLLGSLITEPAAMTVTALLIKRQFFGAAASQRFKYATLGLLFVNISIGGTLTSFAAPPVLMVAGPWNWNSSFMVQTFGVRAMMVVVAGTLLTSSIFRSQLRTDRAAFDPTDSRAVPWWITIGQLGFVSLTIGLNHHFAALAALFLTFLLWSFCTRVHQGRIRLRESLLVGAFLAGLVTLGHVQEWWLKPLLAGLGPLPMFWGALGLTAITDNAALTFLGTLVPTISAAGKYALVAGAVAGGGLTVMANAPNPAGYAILSDRFGPGGISPGWLFCAALPYTLLAAVVFCCA